MTLIIIIVVTFIIGFNILVILYDKKLSRLEKKIIFLFEKRTNLVPSLYEITKPYLTKHKDVFDEILRLRKIEFTIYQESFLLRIQNESQIHHELNFIFKTANQHKKIQKDEKFLLIRDLFIENSQEIGQYVALYKNIIRRVNLLRILKNFTIIGIFIPIEKRISI